MPHVPIQHPPQHRSRHRRRHQAGHPTGHPSDHPSDHLAPYASTAAPCNDVHWELTDISTDVGPRKRPPAVLDGAKGLIHRQLRHPAHPTQELYETIALDWLPSRLLVELVNAQTSLADLIVADGLDAEPCPFDICLICLTADRHAGPHAGPRGPAHALAVITRGVPSTVAYVEHRHRRPKQGTRAP
jgi:hypothetical protein